MIKQQTLTYNRTRQAMITKELIEIISGAEALLRRRGAVRWLYARGVVRLRHAEERTISFSSIFGTLGAPSIRWRLISPR